MRRCAPALAFLAALLLMPGRLAAQADIPLPEHPRPDWQRPLWLNLNGSWAFQFDAQQVGEARGWPQTGLPAPQRILVPFSWAAPLAGVTPDPDSTTRTGWYQREVSVPAEWRGQRVFLVVGASDWHTTAWLDGVPLGEHRGGYTPFEFELTSLLKPGQGQRLVLRVADPDEDFKLEGKQGYGNARGIWQTVYLEARGGTALRTLHFTPDLAGRRVTVAARLLEPAREPLTLTLSFADGTVPQVVRRLARGADSIRFDVPIAAPHLWTLDDPYLYQVQARLSGPGSAADVVDTYFGMRSIAVVDLPGTSHRYVALNGAPIYLQLALDQAYHPEGFYTFPSDDFTRAEILRAKQLGLNGVRVHIKVPLPRKLYWADRLGFLIMADVPNYWGEPRAEAAAEHDFALRGMIARDFNHPSIFSWVLFNESWGLLTRAERRSAYLPQTQDWVASNYRLAKQLDPTRLVEDNSPCCGWGHTETDINSWHWYLPGWEWERTLDMISDSTRPGAPWNFEDRFQQARQPNINSEFGNVWGYEGSTGDVDYTWDYHRAVNAFRRHPAVAGWLYTEHHDVINEWNGYWQYDRSDKLTGLDELVDGMSLNDLHAPLFIAVGDRLSQSAAPGERVSVPLYASFLTAARPAGERLTLDAELYGWDLLGRRQSWWRSTRAIPFQPWHTAPLEPLQLDLPSGPAVAVLAVRLRDAAGNVLNRNFTTFVIEASAPDTLPLADGRTARLVSFAPAAFSAARWSVKQWNVLDGAKVNGAGAGFFEYRVPWPVDLDPARLESATLVLEAGSKQLFGKDREGAAAIAGDYMRGRGTFDRSRNPNSYPMTDQVPYPSALTVLVNGHVAGSRLLRDDPADHRGILSWHYQLEDRKLREAGSYGELVQVPIPPAALRDAAATGTLLIRLEVPEALPGGLALYGRRFGRYPLDPTLVFVPK
ncbi:MAG: glycoside hydrolase family 2 [Gemmatimonadetes bacterium]|nr:glycoside hydrolase family 2 [Gemmatimonadota bacterium]